MFRHGPLAAMSFTAVMLLSESMAVGQGRPIAKTPPELPAQRLAWVNSAPISTDMLKGKAAILYFFEET